MKMALLASSTDLLARLFSGPESPTAGAPLSGPPAALLLLPPPCSVLSVLALVVLDYLHVQPQPYQDPEGLEHLPDINLVVLFNRQHASLHKSNFSTPLQAAWTPCAKLKTGRCQLQNTIVIHTDGLCEPKNPGGWACWGWVALQDGREIASGYGCLGQGPGATNNVAEYMAAIHALRWAIAQGLSEVLVRTDSQLVACHFSGAWECRSEHLRPLLAELRDLARQARARVEWVPRERNAVADALSRRAYEEARQ